MRISDWSSDVCSSDLLLASWAFFALRIGSNVAKKPAHERRAALQTYALGLSGVAVVCAFIGIVFIAIGIGAIFPKLALIGAPLRLEERRVGKEGVRSCRYRWWQVT